MTTAKKILGAASVEEESKLYVDDVFSTYLYAGNGSTQTINNGIDLAGKGGMVWLKVRSSVGDHFLMDSSRSSFDSVLKTSTTAPELTGINYIDPTSTGFNLNSSSLNGGGYGFVSWIFRKAPKFFDVVTYTGDGVASRKIPHELGVAPGMVIVKRTDAASDWFVAAGYISGTNSIYNSCKLNTTAAAAGNGNGTSSNNLISSYPLGYGAPSIESTTNIPGAQYVAYLFAHDPSADGIIQCGMFTIDASGNATVNLGWEPQYLLAKRSDGSSGWIIIDSMRGWPNGGNTTYLQANNSSAESADSNLGSPTATGFTFKASASQTYIYLAIRRPNKPPKTGTEVYNSVVYTGDGAYRLIQSSLTKSVDTVFIKKRTSVGGGGNYTFGDRLRENAHLFADVTEAEAKAPTALFPPNVFGSNTGVNITGGNRVNDGVNDYVAHFFRRAPGFMDVVCYTGDGNGARDVQHGLKAKAELVIIKNRSSPYNWVVGHKDLKSGDFGTLRLNSNDPVSYDNFIQNINAFTDRLALSPGAAGVIEHTNGSGMHYVMYLFTSLPGISKVGNYTGNGTSQTINCGFTTGARFILIKRTDSAGNWYVFDSARGIVSANDPYLQLNTAQAEDAYGAFDSVDPAPSGIIVNQTTININVSGGRYIFLAIA